MTSAPILPNYLGIPFRILVSPFVNFDPEQRTTDVLMFNSKNLGALIVAQEPHVKSWEDGEYNIQNMSIEEEYGFGILNEGQAIAVAKNVKIRPNEFVMPARTVYNLSDRKSSDLVPPCSPPICNPPSPLPKIALYTHFYAVLVVGSWLCLHGASQLFQAENVLAPALRPRVRKSPPASPQRCGNPNFKQKNLRKSEPESARQDWELGLKPQEATELETFPGNLADLEGGTQAFRTTTSCTEEIKQHQKLIHHNEQGGRGVIGSEGCWKCGRAQARSVIRRKCDNDHERS